MDQIREAFAPEVSKKERRRFDRNVAKAQRKDRMRAMSKLTERVDGELRIRHDPPVLVPLERMFTGKQLETAEANLGTVLADYRETLLPDRRHLLDGYRHVHTARKVVGVGSVGTRAWVATADRPRRGRPVVLAGKGGAGVGARALHGADRVPPPG